MRRLQLVIIAGIILFLIYLFLLWISKGSEKTAVGETIKDRDAKDLPLPAIKTEIPVASNFNWQTKIDQLPKQAAIYTMDYKRLTSNQVTEMAKTFGFERMENQVSADGIYIFDNQKSGDKLIDRLIINQNQTPVLGIWWDQKVDAKDKEEVVNFVPISTELVENLEKNNQVLLSKIGLEDPWKTTLGTKSFFKNELEGAGFTTRENADGIVFSYNYSFDNWPIYGQNYGYPIRITYDNLGKLKEFVVEYVPTNQQIVSENLKTKDAVMLTNDRSIKPLYALPNNSLIAGDTEFKPESTIISMYQPGYLYIPEKKQLWPYVFFEAETVEKNSVLRLLLGTSLIL